MSQSIVLDNVSIDFPIYSGGSRSLKKALLAVGTGGALKKSAGGRVSVEALRDVSLRLEHGDRLGLIGHNGAGKTTLLRVMAGVYEPTRGRVRVEGRISTIFDIMLGLDLEATGFENITLQGLLLGMSRQQISSLIDEIAEFTDLGDYLNAPIRTYSAGMRVRLAFAVSTAIEPEILLMDEWVASGDAQFFQRANERLKRVVQNSGILVLASHAKSLIRAYCNKIAVLEHGRLKALGTLEEMLPLADLPVSDRTISAEPIQA